MRIFIFTLLMTGCALSLCAQPNTQNLVIVTLDGLRWQEVFSGVDSVLIDSRKYNHDKKDLRKMYWNDSAEERRKKLFPFFWTTIAEEGQLYGNRLIGSEVNVANPYRFSYPGYNEIFTGYPDPEIFFNAKVQNPNTNVLEYINQQPEFHGKVAAFSSWDVIPYILNEERSGLYVNSDEAFEFDSPQISVLNDLQKFCSRPLDVRPDVLTYFGAREYLKAFRPRVLYIGFD
ncbi:MAG: phosphoglyceromutase, partial [Saprospiraceae bacterium]